MGREYTVSEETYDKLSAMLTDYETGTAEEKEKWVDKDTAEKWSRCFYAFLSEIQSEMSK